MFVRLAFSLRFYVECLSSFQGEVCSIPPSASLLCPLPSGARVRLLPPPPPPSASLSCSPGLRLSRPDYLPSWASCSSPSSIVSFCRLAARTTASVDHHLPFFSFLPPFPPPWATPPSVTPPSVLHPARAGIFNHIPLTRLLFERAPDRNRSCLTRRLTNS